MDAFNFVPTSVNQQCTNVKFGQHRIIRSTKTPQALYFVAAEVQNLQVRRLYLSERLQLPQRFVLY